MAISVKTWLNAPSTATPINAAGLMDLETRMGAYADSVAATGGGTIPFLNVKTSPFNAVGNGVANDRAAIQAALDAANSAGGGTVFLPRGTYLLSGGGLTTYSGVTVLGEGPKSIVKQSAGADGFTGTSLTDVQFNNLQLLGLGGATDVGNGIDLITSDRIAILNCYFNNQATGAGTGGAGALLNNCTNIDFVGNKGLNAGYTMVNFYNSRGFTAVANQHKNTRGSVSTLLSTCIYANTSSSDGIIAGNTSDSDTYPIEIRIGVKRVICYGNSIKAGAQIGIIIQTDAPNSASPCTDVIVANNVLDMASGSSHGIRVDSCNDNVVDGNTVVGGCNAAQILVDRAGAAANGTDNTVIGNTVRGGDEYGIKTDAGCDRTRVVNNKVKTTADQRSIYVASNDGEVLGNYVYDSGFHGIDVAGTGNTISDNRVKVTRNNGNGIIWAAGNKLCPTNRVEGIGGSGVAYSGALPTVASATALTLPIHAGTVSVTGTTTITSMVATFAGDRVTLVFAGVLTFTDGSNLKLNGNFVTTADDSITLVCDGTNWFETARSVN